MDFLGADSVAPVGVISSAVVVGGCLLSEELSPFSTFAERTGSEVLDCEPVLIESERVCTLLPLFPPPLSLLLFSEGGGWFLSHVFIMDNPMELLLLVLLPPLVATG